MKRWIALIAVATATWPQSAAMSQEQFRLEGGLEKFAMRADIDIKILAQTFGSIDGLSCTPEASKLPSRDRYLSIKPFISKLLGSEFSTYEKRFEKTIDDSFADYSRYYTSGLASCNNLDVEDIQNDIRVAEGQNFYAAKKLKSNFEILLKKSKGELN